ncbi:MAG: hypothetical protein JJ863_24440 [Deltaproteobacteria bacterium]|nr:hypothetical protein [Deltaproteobacteria bacterium]
MAASPVAAQTWTSTAPTERPEPNERSFWNVDSNASFTTYAVASTLSPIVWERRRFVETLGLTHVLKLGEDPAESRFQIHTSVALRLDQEFGRDCIRDTDRCYDATNASDALGYQPLARRTRLDVPTFQVELRGPRGLSVRAGRQIGMDPAGMARFDGGRVAARPWRWLEVEGYGGRQVRPGTFGGSPGLGVQGSIHLVLPETLAPSDYPQIQDTPRTWLYGAALSAGLDRYAKVRAFAREMRNEEGTVLSYAGVGLTSRPHAALELRGDLVWELGREELVEAFAEVAAHAFEGTARFRFRHHVPRFDAGSIWGFFDPVPVSQLELALDAPPMGDVRVGGILRGRRSEPGNEVERDLGGELWGRVARGGWRAELRGFLWAGSLRPVAAILGELRRNIGARGAAWWRGSVWRFDDPWRDQRDTTSVSLALGGEFRVTRQSRFALDVEWAHSGLVRHRVRALASFLLRTWR